MKNFFGTKKIKFEREHFFSLNSILIHSNGAIQRKRNRKKIFCNR